METGITLTTLVLAVGAIHLIWQAASFLGIQSGKVHDKLHTNRSAKRADWYVFFKQSALTGQHEGTKQEKQDSQERVLRRDSSRRTSTRRPRLQL